MKYINEAKQMKFEVLKNVAKLAFAKKLDKSDSLPSKIITGKKAKYRCCIYKEREIIRERVILAKGENLSSDDNSEKIVTVIPSACEGCPINRYTVTTNCQKCMAKKCVAACPFGAIAVVGNGAYIDPDKCRECGKCAAACPYNAISDILRPCIRSCPVDAITMDKDRQAVVKHDQCIGCGACTVGCPFGAISDTSSIVDVINLINEDKNVIAAIAPSIEGQFGLANIGMLKSAIKKLGFKDVIEVALGADATAFYEAKELKNKIKQNKKMTTSCCPAFYSMIEKYFPELLEYVSSTVSPMTATARYIKKVNPDAIVVFIGPCIAKRNEIKKVKNTADFIVTFEELAAMFASQKVNPQNEEANEQDASIYGKNFAVSGGVYAAVEEAFSEQFDLPEIACRKCTGAKECKKALTLLKAGLLPEDIIEGMACEKGCISGPSTVLPVFETMKNRSVLLKKADKRDINESLKEHNFKNINMQN